MSQQPLIAFVDVVSPMVAEMLRAETPPGACLELLGKNTRAARLELARRADVLMAWAGPLNGEEIAASPTLRLIQKTSQGVDNIDLEAARERSVPVCNAGGANAATVAEYALLLAMALQRRLRHLEADLRSGGWPNFAYRDVSFDLAGKTVGIIGLGTIGKIVARRLKGFDCPLLYYDLVRPVREVEEQLHVEYSPLDALLRQADVVTLHVTLNPTSYHLVGERELALMRPEAILVNTSRGPVVDEPALVRALQSGRLRGAALDVFEEEPLEADSPLRGLPNVVLTPHAAAGTRDSVARVVRAGMENVARVLAGQAARNVVG